jgi:hypothetical protein
MKMKHEVMALVVRDKRDNHVVSIYSIRDMYSNVSLDYTIDLVSPEELKRFVESYMGKNHPMAIHASERLVKHGVWTDSQEAKDFSDVGNMSICVERKKINWK